MRLPRRRLKRERTHRLIPSRFPPIGIFDIGLTAAETAAAFELEAATNERLNDLRGRLHLIAPRDLAAGDGAGFVMAAFLHGAAGRFNDDTLGAWYAAFDVATAIAEVAYHHHRRLTQSAAGFPAIAEMRELVSRVTAELPDLRTSSAAERARLLDPDPATYGEGQAVARVLREAGESGLLYPAVRHAGGTCLVLWRPRLCLPMTQGAHFRLAWNAEGVLDVNRLSKST
ncbi:MAG TPA: RES family NAD+ phosphorylase [Kiloniellales bacterium]|nr:RES family NAD+ phosphorylase [Kiloniellales bacterium]